MLLNTHDGIVCDRCNSAHKNSFEYYSYDFRMLTVTNNRLPAIDWRNPPVLSLDICPACMADMAEIVKSKYKPFKMTPQRICPQGVNCDLSGKNLKGSYTIYHCNITKVTVKVPTTSQDDRWLELLVCNEVFKEFQQKLIELRKSTEINKWSASST